MINKQSLWFITLFSLILVLGIYYISMPDDVLSSFTGSINNTSSTVEITSSDVIVALKVEEEEKILTAMQEAQKTLLDTATTVEQKNEAYEKLQLLNTKKGQVTKIEELIKNEYKVDSCVTIDGSKINITLSTNDKGKEYANKVIRTVQKLFDTQMYITIKFQS